MRIILISLLLLAAVSAFAQGLRIMPSAGTSDPSAGLEVDFADKGILFPRMTTVQRDAIVNPAEGLFIYNSDEQCLEFYTGTGWLNMCNAISNTLCTGYSASMVSVTDPTCQGGADGEATVTASEGTPPYSYNWGHGQTAATATSLSAGTYFVSVIDINGCIADLRVTVADGSMTGPAAPGNISGNQTPCVGATGEMYSIASVSNATSYNWNVPSSATITSGQGTNSITVDFTTASGSIEVTAFNNCGNSATSTLVVGTVSSAPAAPGSISGNPTPCSSIGVVYSVAAVSSAASYNWTVPSGAIIVNGQGTNSITVALLGNSGDVEVTASNSCGVSSASTLAVAEISTPCPGSISGNQNLCDGTVGEVYSIAAEKTVSTGIRLNKNQSRRDDY